MAGQFPRGVSRIEPSALPSVRAAFEDSLAELSARLVRLRDEGRVLDGPYAAMVALEAELRRIRDSLQLREGHYRRTEGENAARWGRP